MEKRKKFDLSTTVISRRVRHCINQIKYYKYLIETEQHQEHVQQHREKVCRLQMQVDILTEVREDLKRLYAEESVMSYELESEEINEPYPKQGEQHYDAYCFLVDDYGLFLPKSGLNKLANMLMNNKSQNEQSDT